MRGFPCQCSFARCWGCYKCPEHCECRPKLFQAAIAAYGYPSTLPIDGESTLATKDEAEILASAAVGRTIDNTTGLGWPKRWRIVRAEIQEHDAKKGVVIAHCEPVQEELCPNSENAPLS